MTTSGPCAKTKKTGRLLHHPVGFQPQTANLTDRISLQPSCPILRVHPLHRQRCKRYRVHHRFEHGLKSIVPKNVDKFGVVKSRSSSTIPHDNTTMQKLIQKVDKVAKKFGFKVYGNVNVEFTKLPNFSKILNEKIELNNETKTLKQWLSDIKTIDLPLITRKEYIQISASPKENLNQKQLSDYIIMYATIVLGDELLNSAISPLGNMSDQEGIVVNRKDGSQFKITGSFTIRGLESPFQKN